MLDNCNVHMSNFFLEFVKSFGIKLLFTPGYSPEVNPIEYYFNVLKS